MNSPYTYFGSDRPIQKGDHVMVRVKRFPFRHTWLHGVVHYVHDPEVPQTLTNDMMGLNDPVIEIKTNDGVARSFAPPFEEVRPTRRPTREAIEIPESFLKGLGPEMAMDLLIVHVRLKDGRRFRNLAVRGGRYITGKANEKNGESDLDFDSNDIVKVKRARWWPLF